MGWFAGNIIRQRVALMLLVVLAYGCFAAAKLWHAQGDFSVFIVAGDRYVDEAAVDPPITVLSQSAGYDGQFVYRLALDPATARRTDHGITIDTPSLRTQRIGFPLLGYLFSFGHPRLTAAVLVILNIAGLAVISWAASGIAVLFRRPAWHGLVVPLFPGLLLTLSRDTTEIMSTAFAVSAVFLALRDRYWQAGLLACAAVLTRETTLLYLMGFGIVAALRAIGRRRIDWRIAACLLPVLVIVGWQMMLIKTWGTSSFTEVGHNDFGWPLRYLLLAVRSDIASLDGTPLRYSIIYGLVTKTFLLAQIAIVMTTLFARGAVDWRLATPWLAYCALALFFTDAVWVEPYGYLRIFADLYVTGCVLLLAAPLDRRVRLLLTAAIPVWIMGLAYAS